MSPHRLIIHADDFGFTHGITEGIVQAFQEGVLTSTSAMINISGAPERIARARNQEPRFAVGLHLNITTGKPVLPPERVPTLVDRQGCFYSMVQLIERLPSISLSELNAEIRAQVALLKESSGPFDHIDYHQMVLSLYQPFYPLVIDVARDYGVPVRQPAFSRFTRIKLPRPASASQAAIKMLLGTLLRRPLLMIRLMPAVSPAGSNRLPVSLKAAGVSTTDWFIASFFDCPYLENFLAILEQLPEGTSELMCHVGRVDDDLLSSGDTYIYQRAKELEILLGPRVRETIQRIGIELVDFSAVQNT
jgi:chitin disaccharide deacetylase